MKQLIKHFLVAITKNALMQDLLERNVNTSHFLMGVSAGDVADSSGETAVVEELKRHVVAGVPLIIFDVGANKGQFLDMIEHGLLGTACHIHAFEPSKHTYQILSENAKPYSNVTLNNVALGRQVGESDLHYDELGSGLASLTKRELNHFGIDFKYAEKIQVETLDDYCARNSVKTIDHLKLDVEGHELDVLQGGIKMFQNQQIKMVSFEFGGCNIDSRTYFRDFYNFFRDCGINRIFRIAPSGYLVPVHQYKEIYEQFRTTNFLVIANSAQLGF